MKKKEKKELVFIWFCSLCACVVEAIGPKQSVYIAVIK